MCGSGITVSTCCTFRRILVLCKAVRGCSVPDDFAVALSVVVRVQGSIPYVPLLRAPYYVWVGHVAQLATVLTENKVEAPPLFPATFLYTQSWEDPRPDMEVRHRRVRGVQDLEVFVFLYTQS